MRFIRGLQNLPRDLRGCALTIGNFDGMHRGHQALIALTRECADKLGVPLAVICFDLPPREHFPPEQAPPPATNRRTTLPDFPAARVDSALLHHLNPPLFTPQAAQF